MRRAGGARLKIGERDFQILKLSRMRGLSDVPVSNRNLEDTGPGKKHGTTERGTALPVLGLKS